MDVVTTPCSAGDGVLPLAGAAPAGDFAAALLGVLGQDGRALPLHEGAAEEEDRGAAEHVALLGWLAAAPVPVVPLTEGETAAGAGEAVLGAAAALLEGAIGQAPGLGAPADGAVDDGSAAVDADDAASPDGPGASAADAAPGDAAAGERDGVGVRRDGGSGTPGEAAEPSPQGAERAAADRADAARAAAARAAGAAPATARSVAEAALAAGARPDRTTSAGTDAVEDRAAPAPTTAVDGTAAEAGPRSEVAAPRSAGVPATSLAQRIAEVAEALEGSAAPRRLVVESGDLRLAVALQGETVRVTVLGGQGQDATWTRELAASLAARGLTLAGDGAGSEGRAGAEQRDRPDAPPATSRPSSRPAARPAGIRL
jgi:hypothetical protein